MASVCKWRGSVTERDFITRHWLLAGLAFMVASARLAAAEGETRQEFLSADANRVELARLQAEQTREQGEQLVLTNFLLRVTSASNSLAAARFAGEEVTNALARLRSALLVLSNAPATTTFDFDEPAASGFSSALSEVWRAVYGQEFSALSDQLTVYPRNYNQPTAEEQLLGTITGGPATRRQSNSLKSQPVLLKCQQLESKISQRGRKRSDLLDKDFADAEAETTEDHISKLQTQFDSSKNDLLAESANVVKATQEAIGLRSRDLDAIGKRLAQVDNRLAGAVSRQADINSMLVWAVFAVIVAIVAIYVGLLSAKVEIAKELISSRLVIELGTMAFLLLAVIILGLSEKLDKQSLGTLLGAIAGYLLARHSNPQNQTHAGDATPSPPPTPLEISTIDSEPGGKFRLSYVAGGGVNADKLWLQWQAAGRDHDFGHDVLVATSGQSVDTGTPAGTSIRFRTRAESKQGTVLGQEKSAVSS